LDVISDEQCFDVPIIRFLYENGTLSRKREWTETIPRMLNEKGGVNENPKKSVLFIIPDSILGPAASYVLPNPGENKSRTFSPCL
jgi:hypothetical protein